MFDLQNDLDMLGGIDRSRQMMSDFFAMMEAEEKKKREYAAMSAEGFAALADDELYAAALARIEAGLDPKLSYTEAAALFAPAKRLFFTVCVYEDAMENGGLRGFLCDESRELSPQLEACLSELGAQEHGRLFADFISDNGLDVNDLSGFVIEDEREFELMAQCYPFDGYDRAFSALPSLRPALTKLVRTHIEEF